MEDDIECWMYSGRVNDVATAVSTSICVIKRHFILPLETAVETAVEAAVETAETKTTTTTKTMKNE